MKLSRFAYVLLGALLSLQISARAELKLPAVFGDNMVLQQQQTVPVWGWSASGAKVTVKFAGQSKSGVAAADGKWLVKLDKLKASFTPQTLVVEAEETKTFTNILVGEVWLASGQSNMEMPVQGFSGPKPTINADQELAHANFPALRLFKVEKMTAAKPRTYLDKYYSWRECGADTLTNTHFSAVAYFFGRELHTNLNVPVGIIASSWGGTRIEPWTPPAGFQSVPALAHLKTPADLSTNKTPQREPCALYNAMIAPFVGYALRGAIWYQGESNLIGGNYQNYDLLMAALVGGWRQVWDEGDFPFYYVQIAPFNYQKFKIDSPAALPEFWTVQSRATRHIKHTGMVVTTDLVDDLNDIHPLNKKDVGHRLALQALAKTYGKKVASDSLAFEKMKISGNKAVLKFSNTYGGLVSKDNQPLTWFEIAGADGKFISAEAKIVGETVEISAAGIEKPKAVRFAWNQIAQPNLCNRAGLPAEPFDTQIPVK